MHLYNLRHGHETVDAYLSTILLLTFMHCQIGTQVACPVMSWKNLTSTSSDPQLWMALTLALSTAQGELVTSFEDHDLWYPDAQTNNIYITHNQSLILSYCKVRAPLLHAQRLAL